MSEDLQHAAVFGATGLLAAFEWVRSLRAARLSEDMPFAKLRSAAQGYGQFFGVARPDGAPMRSPLTGTPCVWWSYDVRRSGEEDSAVIRTETSQRPFRIEDATGSCLVNPSGAEVTPLNTKRWTSSRSAAPEPERRVLELALDAALTDPYVCIESVIPPGTWLYVQGTFCSRRKTPHAIDRMHAKVRAWFSDPKRRAAFDRNADGRIDDRELAEARRLAAIEARNEVGVEISAEDVIGEPGDDRPFVIVPRAQRSHVVRKRAQAVWALWAALASFGICAWLLVAR